MIRATKGWLLMLFAVSASAQETKPELPVVMVVGGDPMTFFLGGTEVADGICEWDIAGGFRGRPIELVRGETAAYSAPERPLDAQTYASPGGVIAQADGQWTIVLDERLQPGTYILRLDQLDAQGRAYVPDLPGCIATGPTVDAVENEIRNAIRFHIDGLKADGLPVPEPSAIAEYVEA